MSKRKALEETDVAAPTSIGQEEQSNKRMVYWGDLTEVRRSIVRISFDWLKVWSPKKENDEAVMVLTGTILSVSEGKAQILADATFFKKSKKFKVYFPDATGYETEIECSVKDVKYVLRKFAVFSVELNKHDYVSSATFEMIYPIDGESVHTFVFPREKQPTPVGYPPGSVICTNEGEINSECVLFHNCPLHEYGYFGSPVINKRGHFIGVNFADEGRLHTYSVKYLKTMVFTHCGSIKYVSHGIPSENQA